MESSWLTVQTWQKLEGYTPKRLGQKEAAGRTVVALSHHPLLCVGFRVFFFYVTLKVELKRVKDDAFLLRCPLKSGVLSL